MLLKYSSVINCDEIQVEEKALVGAISGAFERFGGNNYKDCVIEWLWLSTPDAFKRKTNVVLIC